MKILVTGASGLLGAEICRQLKLNDKNEVWAVDNHSRGKVAPECDKFLELDLTNGDSYKQLPTDFDYIYHYAAINGTSNFYERPNQVMWTNMVADFNMFELAVMCGERLQKFVYASSSEIVSDDPQSPVPENADITIKNIHNARWSYRLPKICSENFLFNSKIPFVICRYFNVYGDNSKAGHFLADQIQKIKNGVFECVGPEETRSFCHVEDAIRASIHCAKTQINELINIGNDREITIMTATQIIADALGHPNPTWITTPGKAGSTANRRPDISKLRSIMDDYNPMPFEQGVQQIIQNLIDKS
jgi:nucleoside-diphosphate-sugar epimerase